MSTGVPYQRDGKRALTIRETPQVARNPDNRPSLLLVIPAYLESKRLPPFLARLIEGLAPAPWQTRIQIVDDGSAAADRQRLREAVQQYPSMVGAVKIAPIEFLHAHRGKGAAIRRGWQTHKNETVVGFVDADGSVSADEVMRAMQWLTAQRRMPPLFATRTASADRRVERGLLRTFSSRTFSFLAAWRLGIRCTDSQCGFKLLPLPCYLAIKQGLREDGFAIDLEILVQLERRRLAVAEFPISWSEHRESRVRVVRDGWRMVRALERLRARMHNDDEVSADVLAESYRG